MPFYEYRCEDCGNIIEFRSSMDKKEEMAASLVCDSCESKNFAQVFSGIALTGSSSTKQEAPPTGGCCAGGMCGI
ncbi:MAG: hypothetical protein JJU37_13700 [Balneolaceae bacterium]|nr:hypothetical protein [Balneolaceae bacterium]